MAGKFTTPPVVKLADKGAERVRRSHQKALVELQGSIFAEGKIRRDIELPDGVNVPVAHGFGRPATVLLTPGRFSTSASTGRFREVRDPSYDRNAYVVLRATGFGETIYVDAVLL